MKWEIVRTPVFILITLAATYKNANTYTAADSKSK